MKSNKGITLIALVVTIIVVLILASTAAYVGMDAIEKAKEQRYLAELKTINEAVNMHLDDYENLGLTSANFEANEITYNYKLQSESDFNKIGLENIGISDTIYVNFEEPEIYGEVGFNNKHTLKDFGVEYYKPEKQTESASNISFSIALEPQDYSWKYIISVTNNNEPAQGNLLYTEYNQNAWKRVEKSNNNYVLELKDAGIYEIKFRYTQNGTTSETNSTRLYAYVKDGLEIYYDGQYNTNYATNTSATSWADLSGNSNNGNIVSCTWNANNSLEMDGINSTLNCSEININNATIEHIFKDYGESQIESNSTVQNITSTTSFDIGRYINNNLSSYYKGNIYNFRIYNRELSEDELEKNHQIDVIRYNLQEN